MLKWLIHRLKSLVCSARPGTCVVSALCKSKTQDMLLSIADRALLLGISWGRAMGWVLLQDSDLRLAGFRLWIAEDRYHSSGWQWQCLQVNALLMCGPTQYVQSVTYQMAPAWRFCRYSNPAWHPLYSILASHSTQKQGFHRQAFVHLLPWQSKVPDRLVSGIPLDTAWPAQSLLWLSWGLLHWTALVWNETFSWWYMLQKKKREIKNNEEAWVLNGKRSIYIHFIESWLFWLERWLEVQSKYG